MNTVKIIRIKLKSVFKVVLISSVLSIGLLLISAMIFGLIFSLFARSAGGASGTDNIAQLLVLLIPYMILLFIIMLFSLFLLISYNFLAPRLGGLEVELEKGSEFIVEKDNEEVP
jgi:hypothetical protein